MKRVAIRRPRDLRIPDDRWRAAAEAAEANGDDLHDVIRAFLHRYGKPARDEIRAARTAKPDTEETP